MTTKQDLLGMEQRISFDIRQLESKITIKLGTMLGATLALMAAIQKFLIH